MSPEQVAALRVAAGVARLCGLELDALVLEATAAGKGFVLPPSMDIEHYGAMLAFCGVTSVYECPACEEGIPYGGPPHLPDAAYWLGPHRCPVLEWQA